MSVVEKNVSVRTCHAPILRFHPSALGVLRQSAHNSIAPIAIDTMSSVPVQLPRLLETPTEESYAVLPMSVWVRSEEEYVMTGVMRSSVMCSSPFSPMGICSEDNTNTIFATTPCPSHCMGEPTPMHANNESTSVARATPTEIHRSSSSLLASDSPSTPCTQIMSKTQPVVPSFVSNTPSYDTSMHTDALKVTNEQAEILDNVIKICNDNKPIYDVPKEWCKNKPVYKILRAYPNIHNQLSAIAILRLTVRCSATTDYTVQSANMPLKCSVTTDY